ncbi:DMT family transporter [Campylobacter curvus]|uniref:DMT family transporter n=1 Tax=Campylobacter curvus TaxID=200 RepID=UPI00036380B9|nr:SMR family transporter [Campylobacter curvus]QKF61777.1 multidrug efflux system protein, EmrE family [Campylobacter curvus]UEB50071.1 multidrug efflux SMR transporter [Campylobacter curvus]
MAWIYLICAGLMEMGWPVGLKMAQQEGSRVLGVCVAIAFMAASGFLLWLAQREIPIGTSYAVWTSIGAAGTFMIGVWFYGDAASLWKYFGVLLILIGVVVLKVAP